MTNHKACYDPETSEKLSETIIEDDYALTVKGRKEAADE